MSNERNDRLRQFFGAYFHQDWDVEGATTWQDVITQFLSENTDSRACAVRNDLRSWLDDTATEGTQSLPTDFGCDYDPAPDGFTERRWVEQILALLEQHSER
jgi:hypothetical protein